MDRKFNFEALADHDLYHLRYGKGAVIVAVQREASGKNRRDREKHREDVNRSPSAAHNALGQNVAELKRMHQAAGETKKIRVYHAPVDNELRSLEIEIRALAQNQKPYLTELQAARFYSRNLPPCGELPTRFDRVTRIHESAGQVEIDLECYDQPIRDRIDRLKSGVHDLQDSRAIEGRVTRIVPVQHVTLEIFTRLSA